MHNSRHWGGVGNAQGMEEWVYVQFSPLERPSGRPDLIEARARTEKLEASLQVLVEIHIDEVLLELLHLGCSDLPKNSCPAG